jgi:hypothetical protein
VESTWRSSCARLRRPATARVCRSGPAAVVPNPLICHGVLAPRARWRERVVADGRVLPEPTAATEPLAAAPDDAGVKPTRAPGPGRLWLSCTGRLPLMSWRARRLGLIGTLHGSAVIRTILAHVGSAPQGRAAALPP